jgi:myo-inositol-1-phosphate synthase
MTIRVGIVGVGNCAKSLVEGVALYRRTGRVDGLAFPIIGGYSVRDIKFVFAADIDSRKVGRKLYEAIYAKPNCAMDLLSDLIPLDEAGLRETCGNTVVIKGPVLDGAPRHMTNIQSNNESYLNCYEVDPGPDEEYKEIFMNELCRTSIDVLLLYLPVGSECAVKFYVECCLAAKIPFVNCIPVFIVSDPYWQQRLEQACIPAIGDDMRSQVGASVLSQVLQEMFLDRGASIKCHIQTNQGGNTDFLTMCDKERLGSKKKSKENVIRSQNNLRNLPSPINSIHAGPSDYIPYLGDNKVAHIRIEATGFGGAPIQLDCRLSVQDSPNSAGVVIDAIRYLHVAHRQGVVGALYGPSAATQKTPPVQMTYAEAYASCKKIADLPKE